MRFLVTNVGPYVQPVFSNNSGSWAAVTASPGPSVYSSTAIVSPLSTNGAGGVVGQTATVSQKVSFGMSIQDQSANGVQRATVILPGVASSTYVQNEQFTELSCELRELSCELD